MKNKYLPILFLFLMPIISTGGCFLIGIGMRPGKGVVVDSTNEKPIPHATVTLSCMKSQLEGSKWLRDVIVTANSEGVFRYTLSDVAGCSYGNFKVTFEGYKDTASIDLRYDVMTHDSFNKRVPKRLYATPISEVNIQKIKYELEMTKGKYSNKKYEYNSVYKAFYKSKKIAETKREKQFVREKYCYRLNDLYSKLTDDDKTNLQKSTIGEYIDGKAIFINHEKEVLDGCSNL
jgi:hypothetical protein